MYLTVGASAALACTNDGSHYFDGTRHVETLAGAQAYIARYEPRVCDESSAWAMVQNNTAGTGKELAQVGWIRGTGFGDNYVHYFYEFGTSPSNLNPPVILGVVPGAHSLQLDKFSVFETSPGTFTFNINTHSKDTESLDWTPNEGDWLAEAVSESDQTAGDTVNHVNFITPSRLGSVGGTWHQETPAASYAYNTNPHGSGYWYVGGSEFDLWDTRYNSEGY
jgi:hypothetical protein